MPSEEKSEHASTPLSSKKRKTDGVDGSAADKPDKVPSHKSRSHGEVFASVGKGGEGARGRLWVCDVRFAFYHAPSDIDAEPEVLLQIHAH